MRVASCLCSVELLIFRIRSFSLAILFPSTPLGIFLIPTKISKDELKTLEERIQHCGALKSPPAYANTFLTSSKAPKLIASSIRKAFKQEHDEEIDDEKIVSDGNCIERLETDAC